MEKLEETIQLLKNMAAGYGLKLIGA